MKKGIVTSEHVNFGHPDKLADMISDALLDEYLKSDSDTRAGIETMVKDNIVVLGGEVKTNAEIDVEKVVRNVFDVVNYPTSHKLSGKEIKVINLIGKQSQEISKGVDRVDCNCIGAGDQGFVVGFASNETKEYMPLGVYLARKICNICNLIPNLGPDAKTQVCIDYSGEEPKITSIVVSTMHSEEIDVEEVCNLIKIGIDTNAIWIDSDIFSRYIKGKDIKYYINHNGSWNVGGPISDCGLTGRKIVVDQYGGYCNVGGGALSGKDMSKVDRSAAYMCRYLAKNIVGANLADEAKVELSYVISDPNPCSIKVELNKPHKIDDGDLSRRIENFIIDNVDLTPSGIIRRFFPFGVEPIFFNTAKNGHFGHNNRYDNPWERLDLSVDLKEYFNIE